ncbi:MAG TPA: hypothetical protein VFN68_06005, partial [Acidimicrobiales bacterium]|nr:hypothetical protein [Acidimicrobiales bacterium]
LIYATALTVVTLGAGVLIQPVARRLDHAHRPRAILVAMVVVTTGVGAAAAAVELDSAWGAALAALMLGGAYGVALVAGLVEVQRISTPAEQPALTGVYYALSYVGFLLPTALAAGARWVPTGPELAIVAMVALATTLLVLTGRKAPVAPGAGGPERVGRAGQELTAAGSR